ncbi:hypothetical protein BGX34_000541 [Mortierella sp. NVP85]|nr:hypothetical protein BGX34_000541 [Mortierella sp. NVP85]
MTGDCIQEFRVVSASPSTPINDSTIYIPSKPDKTGERIVLWRDIQSEVKNADRVRNGKVLVTFMTGEDFEELVPRRIPYYPGVVLDVIVTSQNQEVAVMPESSMALSKTSVRSAAHGRTDTVRDLAGYMNHSDSQVDSVSQYVSNLSHATLGTLNKSLVIQSDILEREEQRILQRHSQLPAAHSKENTAGQLFQNSAIDDYIMGQLGSMDGTGISYSDIYQMYTIRLMHQMLDRQVVLENRVQALMTQNYELHEYPIPRLFIVLPKPKRRRDKFTHPLTKQFRLYFLCECGEHTTGTGRGNLPNKIHLAKHEGYDLDQPNEFFERYGSYVLAIMKFLKYGAMAAEVVVPPLALFKVVDGLDTIQKSLNMTADTIGYQVDETIRHIQDLQGNEQDDSAATRPMRLDDIEALEGADLRQLQLYLNAKDKGRVLGDLFRIFTHKGHVKWVCIDHYKENYRKAAMRRLIEVVSANKGWYYEGIGIRIELESAVMADQFYEIMIKASGIQYLDIALRWDVTLSDLRKFASVVTKANINRLRFDGEHFKGPVLDILNDGCRYDPIVEMMYNGRIQVMELPNFDRLYQRIGHCSLMTDSQLRKLDLSSSRYSRPFKSILMKLLRRCPCLVELYILVSGIREAFEVLTASIPNLPALRKIEIRNSWETWGKVSVEISQCKIQSVKVPTVYTDNLSSGLELLLREGYLTDLEVRLALDSCISRLTDVVQWNPRLRNIDIWCDLQHSQSVIEAILFTRNGIPAEGGPFGQFQAKVHMHQRRNAFTFEIQDGSSGMIETSRVSMDDDDDEMWYWCAVQQYGWSISTLETSRAFRDDLAAILNSVTEEKGSRIVSLSLDPIALTAVGLECMVKVIERSHDLQHLGLTFKEMHETHQQERMERLLVRFGKRLNELKMMGDSADVWIPKVMALCPTRLELPNLESLFLESDDKVPLSSDCAQWIAVMVSPPSAQILPIPSTPGSTQSAMVSTFLTACEWTPLRTVELIRISLRYDGWGSVVRALDYSTLRQLTINSTGFLMDHLKYLVDCAPVNTNPVGSLQMNIFSSSILKDVSKLDLQLVRLQGKLPNIDLNPTRSEFLWARHKRLLSDYDSKI